MNIDQVDHLADHLVLPGLASVVARGRRNDAETLAFIAVATERKLYLPAGYPTMFAYCVGELGFSEDATFKRTQAARAARKFPALFDAVAAGRLHLSAVVLLAPHLRPENAAELIAGAARKTKLQIECLLAERFPKPDLPTRVQAIAPIETAVSPAPGQVSLSSNQPAPELVPPSTDSPATGQVESRDPRPRLTPLAPQRFAAQFTMDQDAYEELCYLQSLRGHAVPSGDLAEVFRGAVKAHIQLLEQRVFGASTRRRPGPGSTDARHVPAAVKHEVWVRDGGRCTFVSDKGHRCESRTRLEIDHVDPVARGGQSTAVNTRLLCRAHNQHAAECAFGKGFMRKKREETRHRRQQARRRGEAPGLLPTAALGVVPRLRELGFSPDEARRAATLAAKALPDAKHEELVRHAVTLTGPASTGGAFHVAGSPG
jgi:hypothetical protein